MYWHSPLYKGFEESRGGASWGRVTRQLRIPTVPYDVLQHLKAADEVRDDVPRGSLDTHSPWTGSPSQWHAIVTVSAISLTTPVSAWIPVHSRSHSESKRPVSPQRSEAGNPLPRQRSLRCLNGCVWAPFQCVRIVALPGTGRQCRTTSGSWSPTRRAGTFYASCPVAVRNHAPAAPWGPIL